MCPSSLQGALIVGVLFLLFLPSTAAYESEPPQATPDARPPVPTGTPAPAETAPALPVEGFGVDPVHSVRRVIVEAKEADLPIPEGPARPARVDAPAGGNASEGAAPASDPPVEASTTEDDPGSGSSSRRTRYARDVHEPGAGRSWVHTGPAPAPAQTDAPVPPVEPGLVQLAGAALFLAWVTVRVSLVVAGSRLERSEVRDHPVRRRMIEHLQDHPGATAAELGQVAEVGCGRAIYHLSILEREQVVRGRRVEGRRRYFPVGAPRVDESTLVVRDLARPERQTGRIVGVLRNAPGTSLSEIARVLGMSPGQAHYHVAKLDDVGIIYRVRKGRRVRHYLSATGHALAARFIGLVDGEEATGAAS